MAVAAIAVWWLASRLSSEPLLALLTVTSFVLASVVVFLTLHYAQMVSEHKRQLSLLRGQWEETSRNLARVLVQRDHLGLLVRLLHAFVLTSRPSAVIERALSELSKFFRLEGAEGVVFGSGTAPIWVEWDPETSKCRTKDPTDLSLDEHSVETLKSRSVVVRDAVLQVPIAVQDNILGLLRLRLEDPESLPSEDLRLLQAVADQTALAVQRAFLTEMLEQLAITDPLTGVANRRHFDARLSEETARSRRYQYSLGLLLIDVDNFKSVNDRYGHQVGDHVLRRLVQILRQNIRRSDFLARYGGEEFVVLTPQSNPERLLTLGNRLIRTVRETPVEIDNDAPLQLTVSAGAALFPDHADNEEQLVKAADMALLKAKKNGKDCIILYQGDTKERDQKPPADESPAVR